MRRSLVFVYNADSGLFNTLTDMAHKLLSPATYGCSLCALTHGTFTVRDTWTQFLKTLDADCEFLHRDEFKAKYGTACRELPAIYENTANGLSLLVDAGTLRKLESLADLQIRILAALDQSGKHT